MRLSKRLIGVLTVVLVLALAAPLAPTGAQDEGTAQLVPPSGMYAVGRTSYQWVDESREEVHTLEVADDRRELLVEVWYPAEPDEDAETGPYMVPEMADLLSELYAMPEGRLHVVRSNAVVDAPLAGEDTAYPVVIFDPGFSAVPRQYSLILEELASYGYVVLAPSHPYVTMLTVLPDGRVIEPLNGTRMSKLWTPRDIYDAEFLDVWVPDVHFVIQQAEMLQADDPKGLFTGRLDLERIAMVGHSQGGRTISEVCMNEDRCVGAVSLDSSRSALVDVAFDRPYMLILADNGVVQMVQEYERGLEAVADGYYVIMIPQTHHNSFSDDAFLAPLIYEDSDTEGLGNAQYAVMGYRAFIVAFIEEYVRGEDVPLLDGPTPESGYPDVFFLDRTEPVEPPTAGVEPKPAKIGSNLGLVDVGSAEVWTYAGQAGEEVTFLLMADRPANETTQDQRLEFGLLDTVLIVRALDGSVLAANDDSFLGTNSAVEDLVLPADGDYVIEVRSWASQTSGGYTLVLRSSREEE
jgi:predicted dienelactone hydrolase